MKTLFVIFLATLSLNAFSDATKVFINDTYWKKKIPNWKIRNSNSIYLESFIKNLPINFKVSKIQMKRSNNNFFLSSGLFLVKCCSIAL